MPRAGAASSERLDQHLVRRGLYTSRSQAAAAILAGEVRVAGVERPRPGDPIRGEPAVVIREAPRFVSRGGRKLEAALERFPVPVMGAVCVDLGASTGGFTDCLLQHGAARVYAVDVGYGQLALSLRQDPRVVVMERTNARYLTADSLPERPTVLTADLAFISLERVAGAIASLLAPGGHGVLLVKPQFEAGPARVGRRGVVRDAAVWQDVLRTVAAALGDAGLGTLALLPSPVRGPEGNVEFLLWCRRDEPPLAAPALDLAVASAVRAAADVEAVR